VATVFFYYFPDNQLTKLANLLQLKLCLCFVWELGGGWICWISLSMPLERRG